MSVCSVAGCGRPSIAKDFCTLHYQRWKKHGDPGAEVAPRASHGEVQHVNGRRRPTPEYVAWQQMRDRCLNPNSKNWPYYGGRGITICPAWDDFSAFLRDVGRRPEPGYTIDRIENDRGYEPGNVRWATRAEQSRNRRPFTVDGTKHPLAIAITIDGATDTLSGWARRLHVGRKAIRDRIRNGQSPENAVRSLMGDRA